VVVMMGSRVDSVARGVRRTTGSGGSLGVLEKA